MAKKKSKLKVAQEEAQTAVNNTNEKIEELGGKATGSVSARM